MEVASSKKEAKTAIKNEYQNQKKVARARTVIAKLRGVNEDELFSDVPTRFVWLPQVGAGSGIGRDELVELFGADSGLEQVIAFEKQPFAAATFESAGRAAEAVAKWHQALIPGHPNKRLMLIYSQSDPRPAEPAPVDVPGLSVVENFINEEEERALIEAVDSADGWQELSMRRVRHWGHAFKYEQNQADTAPISDLPQWALPLVDRLYESGLVPHRPDQLTVNVYTPGAGIPAHVEAHSSFEDGLASISLGAQYTMLLRHPDGMLVRVPLPTRSLLALVGEARYEWSHAINPRKTELIDGALIERGRRISLTFRKVRGRPCECKYRAQCDTWLTTAAGNGNTRIEDAYVKNVYDAIAPHFSATRYKPWPRIELFLAKLPAGSLVCDVGCGNGKYLGLAQAAIGVDQSVKLLEIARERGHEVAALNALQLPIRDSVFDAVMSIAVVHHFSTPQHRSQALSGGSVLVYVWAMEQTQRNFGQQDVLVPWHLKEDFVDEQNAGDAPRVSKAEQEFALYQRYYHVFRQGELAALMKQTGLHVHEEFFDHANWAVYATKEAHNE